MEEGWNEDDLADVALAGCLGIASTGCQARRSCASTLPKWMAWAQGGKCFHGGGGGSPAQSDQQGPRRQVRRWVPAECLEQKMRRKLSSHFAQALLYITNR